MSFSATSPFWVADQRTGVATLYSGDALRADGTRNPIAKVALTVTIPPAPGRIQGSPTGTVFNGTSDFVIPGSGQRIASEDPLNARWRLALAPDNFGCFSGALLVGNFGLGDGRISSFDPQTGDFLGQVSDSDGNPIVLERLWALAVANDGSGRSSGDIYLTAGINNQQDGLFGRISVIDHPLLPEVK